MPGSVDRSDARPPGVQTVAGSILGFSNFLSWRQAMKLFLSYDVFSESEIKPYIKNENTPVD